MQLRYFILWFFAFVFISISAQSEVEAPDYEKIGKEILDKRGEYYYPALMRRYIANDTTLTISDYRYLYYGFALQEDFNPYRISPYQAKMKSYITSDADINNNCDSIVKYAQLSIDDFPFDTRSMNMLIYAYKCLNRYTEAEMWTIKLKNILDTIITSGDEIGRAHV